MCGIAGVYEYSTGAPVEPHLLERMTRTLVHRGPDAEGFLVRPGCGLGVRRLSIIDVAGGHQPVSNEDETAWIAFNGEIYNYRALRKELVLSGHRFRTQSDTEVVLHAYEDDPTDFLDRLDGMFAFAIYDTRGGGRLLLARDRLGKKPLYYADTGRALVFGSEMDAVLADARVGRDLDPDALSHYLSLFVVPAPATIFRGVRKLPPGHLAEVGPAGVRIRRWWSFPEAVHGLPERDALEETRRLLFAAVEKRLMSEVPLGAFLSGGLDSSVVVAIMSRLLVEPVRTFSVGFAGQRRHDERPFAQALARHCKTEHTEFVLKPDLAELTGHMVRHAGEPFAISSAIPLTLLAREARKHVTVVLTGDGGDESFGGYEHYKYEQWAARYRRLPRPVDMLARAAFRAGSAGVGTPVGRMRSRGVRFLASARAGVSERRLGWSAGWNEDQKRALLAPDVLPAPVGVSTTRLLDETANVGGIGGLSAIMRLDSLVWLPEEMLAKVDRMTMAASIEARCPFLDADLVAFAASLPVAMKVPHSGGRSLKRLLRRSIRDLLPEALRDRPKHGFNVPLDSWFRGELRGYATSMLSPRRVRRRGLLDPGAVEQLLAEHDCGWANAGARIFALIALEVWAQEYLD